MYHCIPGQVPLDTILPDFTRPGKYSYNTFRGASLLHQLAVGGALSTLEQREGELTPALLSSTCSYEWQ